MNKLQPCLLGAVAGDIIGSAYEWDPVDTLDFPLFGLKTKFTDDSVLTVAVADHFVSGMPYAEAIHRYGNDYPHGATGATSSTGYKPKKSCPTTASEMDPRCGSARWDGFTARWKKPWMEAAKSAEVTHNHPEGIKGAQAAAMAVFLARMGKSKTEIKSMVEAQTGYDLNRSLAGIRPGYQWSEICQSSVPESIIAFLESTDFESAIRGAIWLRGDADTMAAIAGGIAEAYYGGVPEEIALELPKYLDPRLLKTLTDFGSKYMGERKTLKR